MHIENDKNIHILAFVRFFLFAVFVCLNNILVYRSHMGKRIFPFCENAMEYYVAHSILRLRSRKKVVLFSGCVVVAHAKRKTDEFSPEKKLFYHFNF